MSLTWTICTAIDHGPTKQDQKQWHAARGERLRSSSRGTHKCPDETVSVLRIKSTEDPGLLCFHEEADTLIISHATTLGKSHKRIIVQCDDVDVLVPLLYYSSKFVFMFSVNAGKYCNCQQFIPVSSIEANL